MQSLRNRYFGLLPDFKQKNTQKFTGVVLTLIALSLFGLLAINPTLSTIAKLQKQIKDNEFVYRQLDKKIIDLNNLKTQYADLEGDLPFILEALPKDSNVSLLTAQIQSIGTTANVRIKKLQQSQVELFTNNKDPKKYSSYSFSILGSGSYEDIYKFVALLSNMQRVVNIDLFNIEKSLVKTGQSLEFNIDATAFFK